MSLELRNAHSVLAALQARPGDVREILLPPRPSGLWRAIADLAREAGVPTRPAPPPGDRPDGARGRREPVPKGLPVVRIDRRQGGEGGFGVIRCRAGRSKRRRGLFQPAQGRLRFGVALPLRAQAVHMDAEAEVLRGGEDALLQLLPEQQGVGAEVDVLSAARQLFHEFADVRVEQRLAAGDADDGRAALLYCGQALVDRQSALEHVRRVLDLPAPRAGEVAAQQRLQHEHERVALAPCQPLPDDVGRHGPRL
jgi:hypothetical protein